MSEATARTTAHSDEQQQEQQQGMGGGGEEKKKKSTLAAKLKGALLLAALIVVAALSTTVLRKPLMASADWLRGQNEAGYAIIGAGGFAFLMLGGSSHLFDLVCGFFCGPLPGFAVSLITKFVATAFQYVIGRFLLHDYIVSTFVQEYVWLRAVDRVLQEKPWSSNFLLRLSIIPAAIKSYGLGALQAPALPFFLSAAVCQAALSYVLTDLGANMKDPSDLFKAESKSSKVLEMVALVACIVIIIAGAYYGKKTVDKLRAEEEARRVECELKAIGLSTDEVLLKRMLQQDEQAMAAEAGMVGVGVCGGEQPGQGHGHHHHHSHAHKKHHHHHHHRHGKEGSGEGATGGGNVHAA